MKNTYFVTCPFCGSNLDPGERCDCNEGRNKVEVQDLQSEGRRFRSEEEVQKFIEEDRRKDGEKK